VYWLTSVIHRNGRRVVALGIVLALGLIHACRRLLRYFVLVTDVEDES
jgi:hypothetical protein